MVVKEIAESGSGTGTEMAEVGKILYMVVVDDSDKKDKGKESFRYTRPVLQSTLQLMGCKARHAFKVSLEIHVFFFFSNFKFHSMI